MTSSSVLRSTWSRISTRLAVPSDASVWIWRSARPRRSVTVPAPACAAARPRGPHRTRRVARARRRGPALEVRPDRVEDREPLLRGDGDVPLEGSRGVLQPGRDALAARALGSEWDRLGACVVDALGIAPDAEDVRRHVRLERQQRGPGRERRRSPEQVRLDAAAGDVAISQQPDRLAPLERLAQLPLRAGELDELETEL